MWHWTQGWLQSDEVLRAVGQGALAAVDGLTGKANPWGWPPPAVHGSLMSHHWVHGWAKRDGPANRRRPCGGRYEDRLATVTPLRRTPS